MSESSPSTHRGIVQLPKADGTTITADLRVGYVALGRIEDTAYVTKVKASELLRSLNKGYLEFGKYAKLLKRERGRATTARKKVSSLIKLSKADDILKAKGLRPCTDLRQAVVEQDADYIAAQDRLDHIIAWIDLLEHNASALKQAWLNVYRQWGERSGPMDNNARIFLDGYLPEGVEAGQKVTDSTLPKAPGSSESNGA